MTAKAAKTPPILPADRPEAIAQAVATLQADRLVVLPTDTVYGVGCNPHSTRAIDRLYAAKLRPADKGIPLLLSRAEDVTRVARHVPEVARRLMAQWWPGPLTLILRRQPHLPANLGPGDTVAVRVPDHPQARRLIMAAGGALAVTSANLSGQPPALTAVQAAAALAGRVAIVLDGGPALHTVPSTIVDCTTTPLRVLRPGPITAEMLQQLLPDHFAPSNKHADLNTA